MLALYRMLWYTRLRGVQVTSYSFAKGEKPLPDKLPLKTRVLRSLARYSDPAQGKVQMMTISQICTTEPRAEVRAILNGLIEDGVVATQKRSGDRGVVQEYWLAHYTPDTHTRTDRLSEVLLQHIRTYPNRPISAFHPMKVQQQFYNRDAVREKLHELARDGLVNIRYLASGNGVTETYSPVELPRRESLP